MKVFKLKQKTGKRTKFHCPECGTLNLPQVTTKSKAFMQCFTCNTVYEIDIKKSFHFRKFCSKIASKKNRSQGYYTTPEAQVKGYLDRRDLLEGYDYVHNARIYNPEKKTYYWIDFYLVNLKVPVFIEISPRIWHSLWGRKKSEADKIKYLKRLGKLVILKENIMKRKFLSRLFDNLLKKYAM